MDRTPVWFMRQAGRYLPEYRELRGDRAILDAIREPEVAVELTLQPLRRMPLDAAIVFADIMVPVAAIGVSVRIESGVGPVVDDPIRDAAAVAPQGWVGENSGRWSAPIRAANSTHNGSIRDAGSRGTDPPSDHRTSALR